MPVRMHPLLASKALNTDDLAHAEDQSILNPAQRHRQQVPPLADCLQRVGLAMLRAGAQQGPLCLRINWQPEPAILSGLRCCHSLAEHAVI